MLKTSTIFVVVLLALVVPSEGIEFYYTLMHRAEHCFEEHLAGQTLVTGEISFVKKGTVVLQVLNPAQDEVLMRELKGEKHNRYSFTTTTPGRYTICLTNKLLVPVELKYKMNIGVEAAEKHAVDQTEVQGIERQTHKLKDASEHLHKEMSDLRKTSNDEQLVSSTTTLRVILFGVLSVAIIIGSAVVQILYLRRFFRQKKIM